MSGRIRVWQQPNRGLALIAGWHQWADAGGVSSGLPNYLIQQNRAARIGRIDPARFYLFQIPGTHHLLRPVVRLAGGHRVRLEQPTNEFFLAEAGGGEFLIFLGTEPHRDEDRYATAFFDAVESLGVRTVVSVAGVHGPVPHRRDRSVSSVYSLPRLKPRLSRLNVRLSDYEGGATIGMYLAARAEERGIEYARLCAYVPTYDFSAGSTVTQRLAMDEDYKAWHDLMHMLNQLLGLDVDITDLASRAEGLTAAWDDQLEDLATRLPRLRVREYVEQVEAEFDSQAAIGEDDLWESALREIGGVDE